MGFQINYAVRGSPPCSRLKQYFPSNLSSKEKEKIIISLVKGYAKRPSAKEIAEAYSVSAATVYRLVKQRKETGTVALRVSQRGRKRLLGKEELRRIAEAIATQPDITIHELTEQLQLPVSEETVRRAVVKMDYRFKKKMIHASEQERPRCTGEAAAIGRERQKA